MSSPQVGPATATARAVRTTTTTEPVAGLALVTIAGTVTAVAFMAVLHVLSPGFDPVQRPTSEYAVGPFGYLMTAVFLCLSAATWALIAALRRDLAESALSRVGIGFLAVWGVGLLVAAAFPIDLDGAPATTAGTIHSIAGPLTFMSLVVGMVLVSRRLKHDERWTATRRIIWPLALLTFVGFLVGGAARAAGTGAGIAQRTMLLMVAAWFVFIALRLRANARGAGWPRDDRRGGQAGSFGEVLRSLTVARL